MPNCLIDLFSSVVWLGHGRMVNGRPGVLTMLEEKRIEETNRVDVAGIGLGRAGEWSSHRRFCNGSAGDFYHRRRRRRSRRPSRSRNPRLNRSKRAGKPGRPRRRCCFGRISRTAPTRRTSRPIWSNIRMGDLHVWLVIGWVEVIPRHLPARHHRHPPNQRPHVKPLSLKWYGFPRAY